ncbi:MAG: DUF2442 domain-containing protein [Eubacterium sp.]|nr:DUF2442 domain-containing protein [Eubacterium sp.]
MNNKHIKAVSAEGEHVLRVEFCTGSILLLDMTEWIRGIRLQPLNDPTIWQNVVTNGTYVRWKDVELSYDEIMSMACGEL